MANYRKWIYNDGSTHTEEWFAPLNGAWPYGDLETKEFIIDELNPFYT